MNGRSGRTSLCLRACVTRTRTTSTTISTSRHGLLSRGRQPGVVKKSSLLLRNQQHPLPARLRPRRQLHPRRLLPLRLRRDRQRPSFVAPRVSSTTASTKTLHLIPYASTAFTSNSFSSPIRTCLIYSR